MSKTNIDWTEETCGPQPAIGLRLGSEKLYHRSRVHWSQIVWYGRQRDLLDQKRARERGRRFELVAATQIFPALEITSVTDLCEIVSSAPFDFIGNYRGERIVIDVTVKWQKRVDAKGPLAQALGFSLFILLVSPRDPTFYHFIKAKPEAKSIRVPFSMLQDMAAHLGEPRHGR